MESSPRVALVAGGTGLVGTELLRLLGSDPRYKRVISLVRRDAALPPGVVAQRTDFERLVHPGRVSLRRMVELFTTGPARVLNLDRGTLRKGAPGDVTVFDPGRAWTYDVNRTESKSKNSPFHNRAFRGGPVATIVGGRVVWQAE